MRAGKIHVSHMTKAISSLRESEGAVIRVDNTDSSEVETAEQTLGHGAISESSRLRLVTDYRVG